MDHFHKQILKKETGNFIPNGPIKILAARHALRKLGHKDMYHELQIARLIKFGLQLILQCPMLFHFYDQLYSSKSFICLHIFGFRVVYKYLIGVIIVGVKIAIRDGGDRRDVQRRPPQIHQ